MMRSRTTWIGGAVAVVAAAAPAVAMLCVQAVLPGAFALALVAAEPAGPQASAPDARAFAGLYRSGVGQFLIVRPTGPSELQITDSRTGEVRSLSPRSGTSFTHGPTRRQPKPVTGTVRFDVTADGAVAGLTWQREGNEDVTAVREPLRIREVTLENGDLSRIRGELILPPSGRPVAVAVVVPLGDRYSLWEPAMWLVEAGVGVFLYDQRHSGGSTGQPLEGSSHTLETLLLADDAVAVTREVRAFAEVDGARVGIVGWSQGGWIGAMVLSRIPDLAFYVNVAANANPWPQQGRHRFWARLHREGFDRKAVDEAGRYFDVYHDALAFRIGWEDYERTRVGLLERGWFKFLIDTFPFFQAPSYAELMTHYLHERDPAVFFETVSRVPTLGVYFEFDQSNPPDSPERFRRALRRAGNRNFAVHVFPGLDHGAWVVPGYAVDSSTITRRGTAPFDEIARWVRRTIR